MTHAPFDTASNRDRARSALAVAGVHALLGYALLTGLGIEIARGAADSLKVFDVPRPTPIEPALPAETLSSEPEGAAAPTNVRASPTPVVAPPPAIRLPVPPPIVAAPIAGPGSEASAGASDVAGTGTGGGGGGQGAGLGSGRFGNGTGGGGATRRAKRIEGRIVNADYPGRAGNAGAEGTVLARIEVGRDGRARDCTVTVSSGNADLDATTCRLIEKRFRYDPARDAAGRPVEDVAGWKQVWWIN